MQVVAVARAAEAQLEALIHPRALPITGIQASAYAGAQTMLHSLLKANWGVITPG